MQKQNPSTSSGLDTFNHAVVLMLENRSFDNLLGYLYDDKNGVPRVYWSEEMDKVSTVVNSL